MKYEGRPETQSARACKAVPRASKASMAARQTIGRKGIFFVGREAGNFSRRASERKMAGREL